MDTPKKIPTKRIVHNYVRYDSYSPVCMDCHKCDCFSHDVIILGYEQKVKITKFLCNNGCLINDDECNFVYKEAENDCDQIGSTYTTDNDIFSSVYEEETSNCDQVESTKSTVRRKYNNLYYDDEEEPIDDVITEHYDKAIEGGCYYCNSNEDLNKNKSRSFVFSRLICYKCALENNLTNMQYSAEPRDLDSFNDIDNSYCCPECGDNYKIYPITNNEGDELCVHCNEPFGPGLVNLKDIYIDKRQYK